MRFDVSFIGLGVMGYPMAGYLANAGHQVTVYNRTTEKSTHWMSEFPGDSAPTPEAAAHGSDFVFCCVGNDDDLRAVTTGTGGAFSSMRPGAVFVDHTTTSAEVARELHSEAARLGFSFVDAPVSGGQAGAENGQLTVMIGGDEDAVNRAAPLIDCYARMQARLGESGSGQLAKMVNQICIAGLVQGLSEALHFADRAGLDAKAVVDVISKGAAQSWQMDNRATTMIEGKFDYGFAVDWMRKDLGYVLGEARNNGAHLPVTALVDQFYSRVQAMGGGRWDTSSLIVPLNRN
ncbi:MAG: NAD(P)-dependent oxidoreductase [Xanthomonadales bacterium]|nr:NAD(P)-dependent oxidoreductase [Gammaproteobacteria bacterium]MBT8052885.1 NAD(P)-dependent oxidoreductase [Gammaproteobacteria bacterium]NND55654.1 NAD(P)-dependent oxidoreductase [Xanthomonadales bacterium]NNK49965.1 NAD(P)-dependent oxidoreductase [Xanthomonadales bacterium]